MVFYGIAWYCMVLHCIAWYFMVLHGIAWYCMVLHGVAWYCTVLNGTTWYCMALHVVAWYFMVLHGIAWYCSDGAKKEGLSKEPLFIKFRNLEFPLPRTTHVTNLTRMPVGETLRQEMSQLIAIKPWRIWITEGSVLNGVSPLWFQEILLLTTPAYEKLVSKERPVGLWSFFPRHKFSLF